MTFAVGPFIVFLVEGFAGIRPGLAPETHWTSEAATTMTAITTVKKSLFTVKRMHVGGLYAVDIFGSFQVSTSKMLTRQYVLQ